MDAQADIKVWDLPTRLFHWLLVLCIFIAWGSVELRWMLVHQIAGVTVLGLLIFRLIWGFLGASTARFRNFVAGPRAAFRYAYSSMVELKSIRSPGHNPAGGLMVIAFLAILFAQATTGLLSNNDLGFSGPLADRVSKAMSDDAVWLHGVLFEILLVMIWLHVCAVLFYVLVKGHNLVRAMLTGRKTEGEAGNGDALEFASPRRAWFVILFVLGCVIWYYPWPG